MNEPRRERMFLALYWSVVGLLLLLFGWWIYYFSVQSDLLLRRVEEAGVLLSGEAADAVRVATDRSQRMFLSEGSFLGLLLFIGLSVMLRAMRREVQLRQQQQDLVSAVTHELKSPIASVRLHLESLRLGRVPASKHQRYLENMRLDIERLESMVDRLLESARMSRGLPKLNLERLDLAEYVQRLAPDIAERESGGRLELEVHAPGPALVEADAGAIETILRNLIANTTKYGGDAPRMRIDVIQARGKARLEVRDFGPGLEDIDARGALRPFARGSKQVAKSRPGVGLGLYLVDQLTRALGGELRAGNVETGDGFRVCIELPLAMGDRAGEQAGEPIEGGVPA